MDFDNKMLRRWMRGVAGVSLLAAVVTAGSAIAMQSGIGALELPPPHDSDVISSGSVDYNAASRSSGTNVYTNIVYQWDFSESGVKGSGWNMSFTPIYYNDTGEYYNNMCIAPNGIMTSPAIDLTSCKNPILLVEYSNDRHRTKDPATGEYIYVYTAINLFGQLELSPDLNLEVSADGKKWTLITGDLLDKRAKYIKISRAKTELTDRPLGVKLYIVDLDTEASFSKAVSEGAKIAMSSVTTQKMLLSIDNGNHVWLYRYRESTYSPDYFGIASPQGDGYIFQPTEISWESFEETSRLRGNRDLFIFSSPGKLVTFSFSGLNFIDRLQNGNLAKFDKDNDGQPDYLDTKTETVYTIGNDGHIYSEKLDIYTPPVVVVEEEEEEIVTQRTFIAMDYSQLSPAYMMGQMFGRDGGSSGSAGSITGGTFQVADLNGDAIPDMINYSNGTIYYGMPNGQFLKESFGGQMFFADFNGDGKDDYVLYSNNKLTVHIVQPEGGTKSKDIISGYNCNKLWCRDVDKDGDPDMVMWLGSFLVVFENDGTGTFKRHEASVPSDCGNFTDCLDFDSDGKYEVLTDKSLAFRIEGVQVNTTAINMVSTTVSSNRRPSVPKTAPAIISERSTGLLKITWEEGTDRETPTSDLTYSLRIGSSPGADDILTADAQTDGTRLKETEGNMGKLRQRIINTRSWPSGKYYIAVQTVDRNYKGSVFSPEAVYEKTEPDNDFYFGYTSPACILDTVKVISKNAEVGGVKYDWDFDGARLLGSNKSTGVYTIMFDTPGIKHITLRATDSKGHMSAATTKDMTVSRTTVRYDGKVPGLYSALDIDEDGSYEYYGQSERKFLENDGNGGYAVISRMFNSQDGVRYFGTNLATIDINHDGMCDYWALTNLSYSRQFYQSINLGDMDMDTSIAPADGATEVKHWIDYNNDGHYDAVKPNGIIYLNDGKMAFTQNAYGQGFYDYDHDGLIDLFFCIREYEDGENVYYIEVGMNLGDASYPIVTPVMKLDPKITNDIYKFRVAQDFDNNGKCDFLFTDYMVWDDGAITVLPNSASGVYITDIMDIDNNGYLDISCSGGIMFLHNNRQITFESCDRPAVPFFKGADGNLVNCGGGLIKLHNEAPSAPSGVRHTQNENFVTVEWNHSQDKETPDVQMLYNVSIKHAGKEGEGAYLFSPANSGKDNVPIPSHKPLIQGNKLKIPIANIPAGDYEVKVQGRDLAMASSPFSETYRMHINESASFDIPATGEIEVAVPVKILVNTDAEVDYDGGVDQGQVSGTHQIVWTTPGTKTLRVGGNTASIYIQPHPDGSFTLPSTARSGDRINVPGKMMNNGLWEQCHKAWTMSKTGVVWYDTEFKEISKLKDFSVEDINADSVLYLPGEGGVITLRHGVESPFTTTYYTQSINIDNYSTEDDRCHIDTPTTLDIAGVTVDEQTGKYNVEWRLPAQHRPEATGINIYRETSRIDTYELIATVPLTETGFIDYSSNPEIKAERYEIGYALSYGTSRHSKAHQPVHVMINRGAGSSWNLIWGSYTGATVTSYRIMRGTSPESMQLIAEVSGHNVSYSDFSAPAAGALYYAVETVIEVGDDAQAAVSRAGRAVNYSRSNVVAAAGGNVNLAESVKVFSDNGSTTIDCTNRTEAGNGLQLVALISPNTATFARVNWTVESGSDVVTVDQLGRVRPTGKQNGTAVVRAMTVDGSALYADISISVNGVSGIESISAEGLPTGRLKAWPSPAAIEVTLSGLPAGESMLYIFSPSGRVVEQMRVAGESVTVACENWAPGVYIAKAVDPATGRETAVKFIKL